MPEPSIRLPTNSGSIELTQARDAGECISCKRNGGGMARISVDRDDRNYDRFIRICGTCISNSIGLHIRAANAHPAPPG